MRELSPSETYQFIEAMVRCKQIPYVAGPPAIGKSDVVADFCENNNLLMIDLRLSMYLPEDLNGYPTVIDHNVGTKEKPILVKRADYVPFTTFPLEGDSIPQGYSGWCIFLDELSSASEEVLAAIYNLLLGHKIGGKKLHKRAIIIAAGNREGDSAIARALPDTIITRVRPCTMRTSGPDWVEWANRPKVNSHDSVVEFIKKYPDSLNSTIPASKRKELETYNNPRGWGGVFGVMHYHDKRCSEQPKRVLDSSGVPLTKPQAVKQTITTEIKDMLVSCVGEISAQAFADFYDEGMSIPFPWDVAQSPSSVKVPTDGISRQTLTEDLAEHFIDTQDQTRDSLLIYMNRMPAENCAMFAQIIQEKLGQTQSDIELVAKVKNRLRVDDITSSNT